MKQPKVSIIIPIYNVERFLDKCVKSVINQTLQDIEIILVDDESPDNCPKMCDEYAKSDSRIKVIHKKNEGLGFARNSGIDIATGEYITFLDSDDFVSLKTYEEVYNLAKKYSLDILRYNCNRFIEDNKYIKKEFNSELIIHKNKQELRNIGLYIFASPINQSEKHLRYSGSACFAIFNRDLIIKSNLRFPSERKILGEDYIFCFKFMQLANSFGYIDNCYYYYRINPKSLTQRVQLDKVYKAIYNCKYIIRMINDYNFPKSSKFYPQLYFINTLRTLSYQIISSSISYKEKKKWLKKLSENNYIKEIYNKFPFKKINYFYRCYFYTIAKNNIIMIFFLSYIISIKSFLYKYKIKIL